MAKKRINLGGVSNSKNEGGSKFIKVYIKEPVTLKSGDYITLETPEEQLASLEAAVEAGKLSEEVAEKIRARIEKLPHFVIAEAILTSSG